MAAPAARVVGLRKAVRALERYGAETQDLKDVFGRIGDMVLRAAKPVTPVGDGPDSGKILASLRAAKSKNKAVVRAGGARAKHAGVRHYGGQIPSSHYATPTNYLSGPADDKATEAIREMETGLKRLADQLGLDRSAL